MAGGKTANEYREQEEEENHEKEMKKEEEEEKEVPVPNPTEKNGDEKAMMTPWEQHSGVIKLSRYDYNAPASLLLHSHSGFLITCTIKREKSATKEALSILEKFVGAFNAGGFECSKNPGEYSSFKRMRVDTQDIGGECLDVKETESVTDNSGDGKVLSPAKAEAEDKDGVTDLSLVKLTRNGLLLFIYPNNMFPDTVNIVSNIIQSLESGSTSLPVWCHRIFPIQATCRLNEKELQEVVSMLVKKFLASKQGKLERPLKFAVGYNRRGIEDTKFAKENSNGSNAFSLLDRNKCFSVVASAVNDVVEDSVVDLRSPELSILVELLPLSRVPNGSLVVAVSALPRNLVSTKPRLCVKALTSNTKEGSVAH
ncbi:uncharacterized protein LOC130720524 isoform X1 [Lotus japonicus]|uniref:uncharacterized protein LOC130720524 isoform X1 n=1 Tax=Lotus japonicus TaxID=34305 RepID=UPI00258566CF|nr:uncharacterized protein LOC130720524 isoform X1 [Lotus japonicus]